MAADNTNQPGLDPRVIPLTEEEKQRFADEEIVLLLSGFNNFGNKIYNYIRLKFARLDALVMAVEKGGQFDIRDYGEVIAAGLGVPPREVAHEIESQYRMISFPSGNSPGEVKTNRKWVSAVSRPPVETPEISNRPTSPPPKQGDQRPLIDFRSNSDLNSFLGKD